MWFKVLKRHKSFIAHNGSVLLIEKKGACFYLLCGGFVVDLEGFKWCNTPKPCDCSARWKGIVW